MFFFFTPVSLATLLFPLGDAVESADSGLTAESTSGQEEQLSQVVSGLRLENQLLRSEVSSLNQEMASLIQRAKDTHDGIKSQNQYLA